MVMAIALTGDGLKGGDVTGRLHEPGNHVVPLLVAAEWHAGAGGDFTESS